MEKINNDFILKDGGYSNYNDTISLPRHRWYYYKEGFSPNLVEKAIEHCNVKKSDLIIDPFNGSGTTTLTSSLSGYHSVGIEVNPFTSFLSETKVLNVRSAKKLEKVKKELLLSVESGKASNLIGFSTFSRTDRNDRWLFNDSVLNAFEGGWQYTDSIKDSAIKKITELALIVSAMDNCNAKRDGKCLRYYKDWSDQDFNKETFIDSLLHNFENIQTDIESSVVQTNPRILQGDCRNILMSNSEIDNFKLCITSPPYLNTFDYTDIYRPELFLGKFIESSKQLYDLRLKTVRSHIQAKWSTPQNSDFGTLYNNVMKHVLSNRDKLMHKNIPMMIQAYFEDMQKILSLLKQRSARNSQVWLVVANSAYAGMEVPVDLIIGEIASKAGWYLKEIGVMRHVRKRKTKHSPDILHLRESVVILSKSRF